MLDLVVANGLAVLPSGPQPADIGIAGGRIAAIGAPGSLASRVQKLQLFGGEPVRQADCVCHGFGQHRLLACILAKVPGVETDGDAPGLFVPSRREGGDVLQV